MRKFPLDDDKLWENKRMMCCTYCLPGNQYKLVSTKIIAMISKIISVQKK